MHTLKVPFIVQYFTNNNGIMKLKSSLLPSNKGYIFQYTPKGLIVNEISEVVIRLMFVKMIYHPYYLNMTKLRIYSEIYTWAFRSFLGLCA